MFITTSIRTADVSNYRVIGGLHQPELPLAIESVTKAVKCVKMRITKITSCVGKREMIEAM